jgi:hypothetical protein
MEMYGIVTYNSELYHFGKKGMKWGVRHERKNYDYRNSNSYRNGNGQSKAIMTNRYNHNKRFFGRKTANKIEYDVANGMDRKKATRRQIPKAAIKHAAVIAGATIAVASLPKAASWYKNQRNMLKINNAMVDLEASMKGLNNVNGGFTPGFNQVKNGKQIFDAIVGM